MSNRILNNTHTSVTHVELTDRVCAHCLGVRGECEESESVEDHPVEEAVGHVFGGQQHDKHHHKLCVKN